MIIMIIIMIIIITINENVKIPSILYNSNTWFKKRSHGYANAKH